MTAVTEPETSSSALAVMAKPALRILRPLGAPAEMLQAQNETRDFISAVLEKDKDYGIIPGVQKPTLLKPGAEKVTLAFGCAAVPTILEREIEHDRAVLWQKQKKKYNNAHSNDKSFVWTHEEGTSIGLYRYVVQVDIVDAQGQVRGSGIGSCSSMESKYVDRPRDSENTILKMATKRAHVASVLATFGLSEQFTQDVEEMAHVADKGGETRAAATETSPLDRTWPNWPNYKWAKQPFRVIPTDELETQLAKSKTTVEKARARNDEKVVGMGERLIETIEYVLEDRRLHPENAPQEKKFEEPAAEAKGEGKLEEKTESAVAAARVEAPHPALLEEDDDDLPF